MSNIFVLDENMYPGTGFDGEEQRTKLRALEAFAGPYARNGKSESSSAEYKYVINVDGVSAAWRVTGLLASGALLIKQESPYFEHYYPLMKPWVHYVPVRFDLQDLVQKVQWAKTHDTEVQKIIANAVRLSRTRLRQQDAQCYMWRTLRSLANLQDKAVRDPNELTKLGFEMVSSEGFLD